VHVDVNLAGYGGGVCQGDLVDRAEAAVPVDSVVSVVISVWSAAHVPEVVRGVAVRNE
jgi:hypothetical protein